MEDLYLFLLRWQRNILDCLALQLPNAMFVFVFEGALFALTYNGDRFVLFTLLPRRNPRTERCSCLISGVSVHGLRLMAFNH